MDTEPLFLCAFVVFFSSRITSPHRPLQGLAKVGDVVVSLILNHFVFGDVRC
jgi:hypothetical protein